MRIKTEIINGRVRTTCSECGEVIMSINHRCNHFIKINTGRQMGMSSMGIKIGDYA